MCVRDYVAVRRDDDPAAGGTGKIVFRVNLDNRRRTLPVYGNILQLVSRIQPVLVSFLKEDETVIRIEDIVNLIAPERQQGSLPAFCRDFVYLALKIFPSPVLIYSQRPDYEEDENKQERG